MNISDVMKLAPRYLTMRYFALNKYVWDTLYPADYRARSVNRIQDDVTRKAKYKQMKEVADEATLLVFILVTRRIFQEGTDAAINTVDTLKELGIKELYLGQTKFAGRNKNVMLGQKLADKIHELLDDDAQAILSDSTYASQIIEKYKSVQNSL